MEELDHEILRCDRSAARRRINRIHSRRQPIPEWTGIQSGSSELIRKLCSGKARYG